jgi:hypothetical protein
MGLKIIMATVYFTQQTFGKLSYVACMHLKLSFPVIQT